MEAAKKAIAWLNKKVEEREAKQVELLRWEQKVGEWQEMMKMKMHADRKEIEEEDSAVYTGGVEERRIGGRRQDWSRRKGR